MHYTPPPQTQSYQGQKEPLSDSIGAGLSELSARKPLQQVICPQGLDHAESFISKERDSEVMNVDISKQSKGPLNADFLKDKEDYHIFRKINLQFAKIARHNTKVKKMLRSITADIKTNILTPQNTPSPVQHHHQPSKNLSQPQQGHVDQDHKSGNKVAMDRQIISQVHFREALVPMEVDNDVPSDSEDLKRGVGLMYGELLYSVGENMQSNRHRNEKLKKKKRKPNDFNKENQDYNIIHKNSLNKTTMGSTRSPQTNSSTLRFDLMH